MCTINFLDIRLTNATLKTIETLSKLGMVIIKEKIVGVIF